MQIQKRIIHLVFQSVYIDVHVITHYGNRIGEALQSLTETLVDFLVVGIALHTLGQLIKGVPISARSYDYSFRFIYLPNSLGHFPRYQSKRRAHLHQMPFCYVYALVYYFNTVIFGVQKGQFSTTKHYYFILVPYICFLLYLFYFDNKIK